MGAQLIARMRPRSGPKTLEQWAREESVDPACRRGREDGRS